MDGLWAPLAGDLGFHRSFPSCVGKLHSADRTRSETFPAHRAAQQAGRQEADVPLVAQPRALPAGEQHHGGAPAPGRPGEAAAGPAPAVSQSVGLSVSQSVGLSVSRSISVPGALGEAVPSSAPWLPARLGRTSHLSAHLKAI